MAPLLWPIAGFVVTFALAYGVIRLALGSHPQPGAGTVESSTRGAPPVPAPVHPEQP